jgi:hypothetical protein
VESNKAVQTPGTTSEWRTGFTKSMLLFEIETLLLKGAKSPKCGVTAATGKGHHKVRCF